MSDAQTDSARDRRRMENYETFLEYVPVYVASPSPETKAELLRRAKETDDVPRGYQSGSTSLVAAMSDDRLERLVTRDEKEWQEFLQGHVNSPHYPKLLAVSPFAP